MDQVGNFRREESKNSIHIYFHRILFIFFTRLYIFDYYILLQLTPSSDILSLSLQILLQSYKTSKKDPLINYPFSSINKNRWTTSYIHNLNLHARGHDNDDAKVSSCVGPWIAPSCPSRALRTAPPLQLSPGWALLVACSCTA